MKFIDSRPARGLAITALAGMLAATLLAATPQSQSPLDELEEVVVSARKPPSLQLFIEYPEFDSVAIAPSGTQLAMGWTDETYTRLLTVTEFPSMKRVDNQLLQQHMGAADLRWAGDNWLIVQPDYPRRGFRRARDPVGSLFVLDVRKHIVRTINTEVLQQAAAYATTGGGADPLSEQRKEDAANAKRQSRKPGTPDSKGKPARDARGPVRLVAARTAQPEQSLFQTLRTEVKGNTDGYGAFALNLPDMKQSRVAISPLPGAEFVTGPEGRIALATGVNDRNEQVVYYLQPQARTAGKDWQLLVSSRSGERGLRPIAWTGSDEQYYALDGRGATRTVVIWNAASNAKQVLHRDPYVDMDGFALDPAGKPWMFSGAGLNPVYWYPDPAHPLAQLHKSLSQRLRGEQIEITSASDDLSIAVVRVSSGRRTPVYIVMDVKTGASLQGMQTYPKLRTSRPAEVDPIEFQARDGLLIRGFLTTPVDADGKRRHRLPLVVIAHDGPPGDPGSIRYETERQMFASRGYAVLQVNHRGSTGRGTAFERAGDGKWGREVQDDFADGVRWAIKDGVAAEGRVCFYGTRYGAYSALMAAAREPDLFQCVIGASGIYDLPAMLGNGKNEVPPALSQVLGSDMQDLKDRSPVSHAAAIKAKVLLVEQGNDELVSREQFTHMRTALLNAGRKPAVESIGAGNDGYFTTEGRVQVYERLLDFVQDNIGN